MKKIKEEKNIIEIQEEIKVGNVILEKGDRIKVLNEELPSPQYNDYVTILKDISPKDFINGRGSWLKAGTYSFTYGPTAHTYRVGDIIVQDHQFFDWYKKGFVEEV